VHFIRGGLPIDKLELDVLVGRAQVVHVPDADLLTAAVLDRLGIPPGTERVLFRTRNSELWACGETRFDREFVAISQDGARWLVERGVRLVGIDYLSVGSWAQPVATHQVLLGANVIAVEGLDLSGITPGEYLLVCLPLRLAGGDGAPARAILIEGGL
jgi:arylformamidase